MTTTTAPFPNVNSPMTDSSGNITPVWRRLIQTMWQNLGGQASSQAAPAAGNSNQAFNVSTAIQGTNALPLSQANGLYSPIAGNQVQVFAVGNAAPGTNNAPRRSQCDSLYIGYLVAGAAVVPIAPTASPFTYATTTAGTLVVSGGTVTTVVFSRAGVNVTTQNTIPLRSGDSVTVTYTAAPTMNFIPA